MTLWSRVHTYRPGKSVGLVLPLTQLQPQAQLETFVLEMFLRAAAENHEALVDRKGTQKSMLLCSMVTTRPLSCCSGMEPSWTCRMW